MVSTKALWQKNPAKICTSFATEHVVAKRMSTSCGPWPVPLLREYSTRKRVALFHQKLTYPLQMHVPFAIF